MVPQMSILAHNYSTDILWCDCGAANGTAPFAADWFNAARSQNRQVTINSRCGVAEVSDFDTPEYATFSSAQLRKWESNMSMDPYSYGYNRATSPPSYMNASTIITDLVDMVSKNGNFLLDIGPRADGSIVDREAMNLQEAGKWIHSHSEAIFNTTYWFIMSEANALTTEGDDIGVRFTQSTDAFYLLFLDYPTTTVYVNAPLPLLPGDRVIVFGNEVETDVQWTGTPNQGFTFRIPDGAWKGEEFTWVLKIEYLA